MQAAASPKAYTSGGGQKSSPVLVLGLFVIVLAALVFGAWNYLFADPSATLDPLVDDSTHAKGDASAPVSVVVFNDFQCRECGTLAREVLPELDAEFIQTGVARLAFRHYPMDGGDSLRAALASECAAQQGKFWDLHDVLYGWKAPGIKEAMPADLARQLAIGAGVTPRAFDACMRDPSTVSAVERDLLAGHGRGVAGAPAVFVNGAYAGPSVDYTRLRALILKSATSGQ